MARLTWFVSLPGFALVLAGLAVVALLRWRATISPKTQWIWKR